jgi:hypothetical protein
VPVVSILIFDFELLIRMIEIMTIRLIKIKDDMETNLNNLLLMSFLIVLNIIFS